MNGLSEAERDLIADVLTGHPMTLDVPMPDLYAAVEAIVAARLASVEALADEWEAEGESLIKHAHGGACRDVHEGSTMVSLADILRAVLGRAEGNGPMSEHTAENDAPRRHGHWEGTSETEGHVVRERWVEHTAENGLRGLTRWPLRWPLNLFCSHPSTTGLVTEQSDGSLRETDVKCLRCGRVIPPGSGDTP